MGSVGCCRWHRLWAVLDAVGGAGRQMCAVAEAGCAQWVALDAVGGAGCGWHWMLWVAQAVGDDGRKLWVMQDAVSGADCALWVVLDAVDSTGCTLWVVLDAVGGASCALWVTLGASCGVAPDAVGDTGCRQCVGLICEAGMEKINVL